MHKHTCLKAFVSLFGQIFKWPLCFTIKKHAKIELLRDKKKKKDLKFLQYVQVMYRYAPLLFNRCT